MRKMRISVGNISPASAVASSSSGNGNSNASSLMVLLEGLRRILPVVHEPLNFDGTRDLDEDENGRKFGLDVYDDEERYSVIYLPDVAYSTSEIVWGVILFSAIFCVNGSVLWAIAKSRELWKPRHLWVACLCVADVFVGLHKVFELMLLMFPQRELCIFKRSTLGIPYVCNMLILTLLSLDRYIAVRCPFYYSSTITRKHVVAGFLFVLVSGGVLVAISMYFGFRDPVCRPQRVQLVSLSIVLSICSIIIFLFNSCVLRIAKKQLNLITAKTAIRSRASSTKGSTKANTYTRRISLAYQTFCMRGVDLHSVPSTPSPPRPPLIIHADKPPGFFCDDCEIDSPDPQIGMELGARKNKIFNFPMDDEEEEIEIEIVQQIQAQIQEAPPIPSTSRAAISSTNPSSSNPAPPPDNVSHASQGDWSAKFRPFVGPDTYEMSIGRQLTSPLLPLAVPIPIPITVPIPLPITIPGAAVISTPPTFPPNDFCVRFETLSSKSSEERKKLKSKQKEKKERDSEKDKESEIDKESVKSKSESKNGRDKDKDKTKKWPIALPIPLPKFPIPSKISLPTKIPSIQLPIPQIPLFKKFRDRDSESGTQSTTKNWMKSRGQRAQSNLQQKTDQNVDTASAQEAVGAHLSETLSPLTRAISLPSFPRAVMVVIPPDPTMPATVKILTCADSQRDILRFIQDDGNGKFDPIRFPGQGQKETQKARPLIPQCGSGAHISQNPVASIVNPPYTIKVALPRSRSFTCGKRFEPKAPEFPAVHPYPRGLHLTRTHGIFHVWKLFPSIRFARTVLLIMVPMWIFLLPIVTIIPMQRKCMQRKQGEYELECDLVNRLWAYLQIHMRSVLPLQAVLDTLIYATGSKEFRRSFQKCIFDSPSKKQKNEDKIEQLNRRRLLKNRRETGVSASSTVQFRVSESIP